MHTGNHSAKSTGKKTDLEPGEYIITDLQGPYVRDRNGEKYSQIFIDRASGRVWVVRLKKKKESDTAIEKVLANSRARSGRKINLKDRWRRDLWSIKKVSRTQRQREIHTRKTSAIRSSTECRD